MGTSSGRLAAEALQHAREQIGEIGEQRAWERWQDDRIVWRLAEGPDGSPQSLFAAGHVLMTAEPDRQPPAALLAAQYVVGALLLVLTWHGWPPSSPWLVAAPGWSPGGDGKGRGVRHGDDPLARALAALGQACDRARSRPAVLRELRRLQHGLALVRGALVREEQAAVRRARQAGSRAAYTRPQDAPHRPDGHGASGAGWAEAIGGPCRPFDPGRATGEQQQERQAGSERKGMLMMTSAVDPQAVGARAAEILDVVRSCEEYERLVGSSLRYPDCWATFTGYPIIARWDLGRDAAGLFEEGGFGCCA